MGQQLDDESRTVEFGSLFRGVQRGDDGVWRTPDVAQVSYPIDELRSLALIEDHSYWFNHRNRVLVALMERYPAGGMLLDIGGGNGVVSAAFRRAGFPAIVLEPGGAGIAAAMARDVPAVQATLKDAKVAAGSFAVAGMFDVLEHIDDEADTLAEVRQLLVGGGRLLLTVPAYSVLWSAEDVHAGHFRRYTRASLVASLEKAGFQVEFLSALFAALVLPIFAFRSLPSLFGLRSSPVGDNQGDHQLPPGFIGRFIRSSLDWELGRIRAGSTVPVGSSLVAVCRRAS